MHHARPLERVRVRIGIDVYFYNSRTSMCHFVLHHKTSRTHSSRALSLSLSLSLLHITRAKHIWIGVAVWRWCKGGGCKVGEGGVSELGCGSVSIYGWHIGNTFTLKMMVRPSSALARRAQSHRTRERQRHDAHKHVSCVREYSVYTVLYAYAAYTSLSN